MLEWIQRTGVGVALIGGLFVTSEAGAGLLFTIDAANSSVSLTETGGGGVACALSSCGIEVSLAPGLGGTSFELDTGESASFDFLTFTADGTTGVTPRQFDITATLAFITPPGANTTGNGSGFGFLLGGYILAGNLTWTDVPREIGLSDGSTVTINFQGGTGLLLGHSITTTASVAGTNIVPEPGLLAMFGTGLLGLGAVLRSRRK